MRVACRSQTSMPLCPVATGRTCSNATVSAALAREGAHHLGSCATVPKLMAQQENDPIANMELAELREHATALQRELDRRAGIEGALTSKLEVQDREAFELAGLTRLLVDSVQDYAIFMLDPTGHVMTWNVGAERCKGYAAGEIIGRHFSAFYRSPDVAAGKCEYAMDVAVRAGKLEEEGWRVRKDGS
jgi:PAS domain-containing protein